MKISVITFSFHQQFGNGEMDLVKYLDVCKDKYGLGAADIWDGTLGGLEEENIKKVKGELDKRGLELANLAVDGAHLWAESEEERQEEHKKILRYLDAAEALGAKTVRVDWGPRENDELTEQQFDAIVKGYKEYCQRAKDNGYRIGPENHFGPERTVAEMERVAKAIDNPAYGVLLHINRWNGDGMEGDKWAVPHTMHNHIYGAGPEIVESRVKMLKQAGYDGYWGIEAVPKEGDAVEKIGEYVDHLKKMLAELGV